MNMRDSVIFLCTGNICRSPMGEGLLRHAIAGLPETSPLKRLRVVSAGTFGEDGMRASPNSVEVLKRVGIDISGHIARTLDEGMMRSCFALFAMTRSHLDAARREFPPDSMPPHMMTLLSLDPGARHPDVMDPYGCGIGTYVEVRDEIMACIPHAVKFLERELSK